MRKEIAIIAVAVVAGEVYQPLPHHWMRPSDHIHVEQHFQEPGYSRRSALDSSAVATGGPAYLKSRGDLPFIYCWDGIPAMNL